MLKVLVCPFLDIFLQFQITEMILRQWLNKADKWSQRWRLNQLEGLRSEPGGGGDLRGRVPPWSTQLLPLLIVLLLFLSSSSNMVSITSFPSLSSRLRFLTLFYTCELYFELHQIFVMVCNLWLPVAVCGCQLPFLANVEPSRGELFFLSVPIFSRGNL